MDIRAQEIAKAMEEYQQRRRRLRPLDPFSWLDWLIGKGLRAVERGMSRLVRAILR